jgi:hypothetical protein
MRPSPTSPQAWSPPARAQQLRAVGHHLRQVALGGRVGPHLAVHGRRQKQRAVRQRPGQAQQASSLVGPALRQPGDEIGTGRRHQHGVGLARQVDVRHAVGLARIPLAGVDRPAGQRLHRHRRDELRGRLGHHHLHLAPAFTSSRTSSAAL